MTATKSRKFTCLCGWEYVDAITSHGRDTIEVQLIDSFCYGKGVRAIEGMTWNIRHNEEQDNG